MPERLLVASAVGYALVFGAVVLFDEPGRAIGHGFYLPVILAALATGPFWGAAGGLLAVGLFWFGLYLGGNGGWSHMLSIGGGVRFFSFVLVGATVGYFARRARRMMGDSLHVLDELLALAARDLETGISSADGFESAVNRRLYGQRSFVLLVGDRPEPGADGDDAALRAVAARLHSVLDPDDELGRIGGSRFAVLRPCRNGAEARAASARLERALDDAGCRMSFGCAMYPSDGSDLLSLYHVAGERLYARMSVRGEWRPTATSAGLVEDLERLRNVSTA